MAVLSPGPYAQAMNSGQKALTIQLIGGPTALLEIAGLRLVTDPTFDPPGDYPVGSRVLTKTKGPALGPDQLGPVDAVLLSHDQHPDNLDKAGRQWLAQIPVILTTVEGATRIPRATGLVAWETNRLVRPDGGHLQVTALPARHGPQNLEHLTGPVTGFLITGRGLPTVYISGDNASLALVTTIAQRVPAIDVAILHAGAARTALLGPHNLTLDSTQAARAAAILGATAVIPVHFDGWQHFSEGADALVAAFARTGQSNRLHVLTDGARFII
ncbi:MAG: MBL fold metallo-hydrolase [Thermaerobacter sp.]|nr:MBL fold metallo-hydrolase [Thermaerobacter sp.]